MANITIYKSIFALALTVSNILTFQMLDLQKVGQGHMQKRKILDIGEILQFCPNYDNIDIFHFPFSKAVLFLFLFYVSGGRVVVGGRRVGRCPTM